MTTPGVSDGPREIPPPRDRDILTAVLRLAGALAERLTGQIPVVKIENEAGDFVWCRVSTEYVRWEPSYLATPEAPPGLVRLDGVLNIIECAEPFIGKEWVAALCSEVKGLVPPG